jgi:Carbohydrate binding domain
MIERFVRWVAVASLLLISMVLTGCDGRPGAADATRTHQRPPPRSAALPHVPGANLIHNASFEHGLSFWFPYPRSSSHIASIPSEHKTGKKALRAVALTAFPFGVSTGTIVGYPSPGSRYLLSAWLKAGHFTHRIRLTLELVATTRAGQSIILSRNRVVLKRRWEHFWTFARNRLSDLVSLSAAMYVASDVASGATFFVDDVRLAGGPGP